MNVGWIIAVFVIIDTVMERLEHHSDVRARVPDAEILTIAVVAAKYFHNHHERAVCVMRECRYLSGSLSVSRFNRRLHRLAAWVPVLAEVLGELASQGEIYVIDSVPLPVCRRVRARRCRKVRGSVYCGFCAAKEEKFFGWRLHLVCTPHGVPVRFSMLPGSLHDLTAVHELTYGLPRGARVFGDKAFNSRADEASIAAATGVRLVPIRKRNMRPHAWFLDDLDLRAYRHTIETVNSQLESMGVERLRARTNQGFDLKVLASLLALAWTNLN